MRAMVLVVEDEPFIRSMVSTHLDDEGFQVIAVETAPEALSLLEEHPEVGVVLTDINIPGPIDGLDLASQVRRTRPELHVIVTSGRWMAGGRSLPDGVTFMHKPYSLDTLVELIRDLIKSN